MRTYDAGLERQWLAETLAAWEDRGFIESAAAQRFDRRLRRLARAIGWDRDRLMEQVRDDVEQIRMNEVVEN